MGYEMEEKMNELNVGELSEVVLNGNVLRSRPLTEKLIEAGNTPEQIIEEGLLPGLTTIGEQYENGEAFLPELFSAGAVAKEVVDVLTPYIASGHESKKGTIVIGTVFEDVHDIGMNLIAATLMGAGYKVINLGANVPDDKFIDALVENNANVLALSALLSTTMPRMKEIIEAMEKDDLRKSVKVIVGGAPLDDEFAKSIGADAYGMDPRDAIRKVHNLVFE
jgi:5-methyltetrahydrofolate--homocysteine methyltransferase